MKGLKEKTGISRREKRMRATLLLKAERSVSEHNSNPDRLYNQKLNKFSLMTKKERAGYLGLKNVTSEDDSEAPRPHQQVLLSATGNPSEFNHRDHGHVTYVKDQKWCGSCWAFAGAGAFEGAYVIATKVLKSFSVKELLDCTYSHKGGCRGGSYGKVWKYIRESGRLASEKDVPYRPIEESCDKWNGKPNGILNAEYVGFEKAKGNHEVIKTAIRSSTPAVSFTLEDAFFRYTIGHYDGCQTPTTKTKNHAIILVGYGPEYWEGKNSWGADWGDQGFVKFTRSRPDVCRVLSRVRYPLVRHVDRGEEDEPDAPPEDNLVEIAAGKIVSTSDEIDITEVVDGGEDTCYTTQPDYSSYFKINLGKTSKVQKIEIVTDNASSILHSVVYVGEFGNYLDTLVGTVMEVEDGKAVIRPGRLVAGSWVYLERDTVTKEALSVCEIKVFATREKDEEESDCPAGTALCPDGKCKHVHMC